MTGIEFLESNPEARQRGIAMSGMSTLNKALERVWTEIRTRHQDVRPAVIVVYRNPGTDTAGHYQAKAWTQTAEPIWNNPRAAITQLDEIHINSITLLAGVDEIFHTLLHEAAHSIAQTRGINDTSRQGRYHNANFNAIARELGLNTEKAKKIGWTTTHVEKSTIGAFFDVLAELDAALTLYQAPQEKDEDEKRRTGSIKAVCPGCGRIIRMSSKSWSVGPIICQPCLQQFQQD